MQPSTALAIVRIITGLLLVYHGFEVFSAGKMQEYLSWESLKALPASTLLVYLGKIAELIGGLALVLGIFTRIASAIIIVVMLFICFYLGNGRFWYEDQHPFLLALLAFIYFVGGAGKWSIDQKLKAGKS